MTAPLDQPRSLHADVRNPLLTLPAMHLLRTRLGTHERAYLRDVLRELAQDARERAEKCWRTHKAPMAVYWKAVAVYAGHTARALR